jgi:hypothetical protein
VRRAKSNTSLDQIAIKMLQRHLKSDREQNRPRNTSALNLLFWLSFGICVVVAASDVFLLLLAGMTHHLEYMALAPLLIRGVRWLLIGLSPLVNRVLGMVMLGVYLVLFLDFLLRDIQT